MRYKKRKWSCPVHRNGSNHDGTSTCLNCWTCARHCECDQPQLRALDPPRAEPALEVHRQQLLPMPIVPLDSTRSRGSAA